MIAEEKREPTASQRHWCWLSDCVPWGFEEQFDCSRLDQWLKLLIIDLISLLLETERDPGFLIVLTHWKKFLFWVLFEEF